MSIFLSKKARARGSKNADNGGFTLIELLIVVAIIAILAAIALPQFSAYKVKANNAAAMSDVKTFATLMEAYYNDYGEYPMQ